LCYWNVRENSSFSLNFSFFHFLCTYLTTILVIYLRVVGIRIICSLLLIIYTIGIGTLNYIISFSLQLWNNIQNQLSKIIYTSRRGELAYPWPSAAAVWFSVLFLFAPFPIVHKLHYLSPLYFVLFCPWALSGSVLKHTLRSKCCLLRGSYMTYCTMIPQNALFNVEFKYECINYAKFIE